MGYKIMTMAESHGKVQDPTIPANPLTSANCAPVATIAIESLYEQPG